MSEVISIEVQCASCGADLETYPGKKMQPNGYALIIVEPCPGCLEDAAKERERS